MTGNRPLLHIQSSGNRNRIERSPQDITRRLGRSVLRAAVWIEVERIVAVTIEAAVRIDQGNTH